MLVQDQAFDFGLLFEHFGGGLGEAKARRDVGYDAHPPVIDLARQRLAVRLIDQRQHRGGMGVVDEFMRQESVEQGLDRGVRRGASNRLRRCTLTMASSESASSARSFLSGSSSPPAALRLDVGHVPARTLDADHLVLLAEIVVARVFTEVLPPPCSTSSGSRPKSRVV